MKASQRTSVLGIYISFRISEIVALSCALLFSNCQGSLILDILRYARIEPQVLQVELHPYLTQEPLVRLAKTLGIALTAYSSFGPQSYLELGMHQGVVGLLDHDAVGAVVKVHERSESYETASAATHLMNLSQLLHKFYSAGQRSRASQSFQRATVKSA